MAYPLADLLSVRDFRAESAAQAMQAASLALRAAEAALARQEGALAAYRTWRAGETGRRYRDIMGRHLAMDALKTFRAGLSMLTDLELEKETARDEAARALEAARESTAAARSAWRKAERDRHKIRHDREEWQKMAAKDAERLEELEMEEFKPILFAASSNIVDD
jgi:type III secretion protein O